MINLKLIPQGYLQALLVMAVFKQRLNLKCTCWLSYFSDARDKILCFEVFKLPENSSAGPKFV